MRGEIKELLFLPPSSTLVISSWHVKQKNQHWEGRSTTFCRNMGTARGCPNFINQKRKHSEIRMRIWVSQDRN